MAGRGSGGNVIAALCSFFIPGLGQLLQGRPFVGLIHLAIDLLLWMFMLGWLMHIYSAYSAAVFDPDGPIDRHPGSRNIRNLDSF